MCPEIVCIATPEAVEAILLGRVNKPVSRMMCYAQPRHSGAWSRVGKTWFHDRGAYRKRLADVGADILNEASDIALRISALNDIHVRRVVEGSLQFYERGVNNRSCAV